MASYCKDFLSFSCQPSFMVYLFSFDISQLKITGLFQQLDTGHQSWGSEVPYRNCVGSDAIGTELKRRPQSFRTQLSCFKYENKLLDKNPYTV